MKNRLLTAVAVAGLLCMGARADISVTIDGADMTLGWMNTTDLGGGDGWGSAWGVPDLSATFNGAGNTVTLLPNSINDPAEYWYIGGGATGNPGNRIMEANLYAQVDDTLAGQTVTFAGNVTGLSLTSAHTALAYIKDFAPDFSSFNESTVALDSTGAFSIDLAADAGAGRHVQWGIQMTGENVWATDLAPFGSVTVAAVPEPATMGLIGIFGGAMLFMRRRFKS